MYLTQDPIDPREFFSSEMPGSCGAVSTFTGIVRDHHEGKKVRGIFYECYLPMANKEIHNILKQVEREFPVQSLRVLHRIGQLKVGDIAVAVEVVSTHRKEAFAACQAIIDRVKDRVPIWKKEQYDGGQSDWVVCQHG
jgi:molybdopterin synthase catalytic subunit